MLSKHHGIQLGNKRKSENPVHVEIKEGSS